MDEARLQTLSVNGFPLVIVAAHGSHYLDLRSLARRMRGSFPALERFVLANIGAQQMQAFPALRCVGVIRQAVGQAFQGLTGLHGDAGRIREFHAAWPVADAVLAIREGECVPPATAQMLKRQGFHAEVRLVTDRQRNADRAQLVRELHALLVKDGLTLREASEKLKFAASTLCQIARHSYPNWSPAMDQAWCETFGQEPYRPDLLATARRKLSPEALTAAHAHMRSGGMSQSAAAHAIGVSPATLSLAARREYHSWSPALEEAWKGTFGKD